MLGKKISPKTIPKILNKENLKCKTAFGKPYISKKNATKNMKFTRDHIFEDQAFWDSVLCSDESKYHVFEVDRRKRVWRYLKEALKPQNLKSTIKHECASVMV